MKHNIFGQLCSHVLSDMHHTLSLAMVTVMSHGLILEKIKVDLDFLIGWGFFKIPFDSFAQFFTKQHNSFSIFKKIDSFYLAGFSHWIMFPECTLSLHMLRDKGIS